GFRSRIQANSRRASWGVEPAHPKEVWTCFHLLVRLTSRKKTPSACIRCGNTLLGFLLSRRWYACKSAFPLLQGCFAGTHPRLTFRLRRGFWSYFCRGFSPFSLWCLGWRGGHPSRESHLPESGESSQA